jgi:hypothetical protein
MELVRSGALKAETASECRLCEQFWESDHWLLKKSFIFNVLKIEIGGQGVRRRFIYLVEIKRLNLNFLRFAPTRAPSHVNLNEKRADM